MDLETMLLKDLSLISTSHSTDCFCHRISVLDSASKIAWSFTKLQQTAMTARRQSALCTLYQTVFVVKGLAFWILLFVFLSVACFSDLGRRRNVKQTKKKKKVKDPKPTPLFEGLLRRCVVDLYHWNYNPQFSIFLFICLFALQCCD